MSLMSPSMVSSIPASSPLTDSTVLSGLTSQPAMGAVCAALEQSGLGAGISHENIQALNTYWSQIRQLYQCFEANVRASDSGVFDHEMPGG
jgi:pyruvate carboxylase